MDASSSTSTSPAVSRQSTVRRLLSISSMRQRTTRAGLDEVLRGIDARESAETNVTTHSNGRVILQRASDPPMETSIADHGRITRPLEWVGILGRMVTSTSASFETAYQTDVEPMNGRMGGCTGEISAMV